MKEIQKKKKNQKKRWFKLLRTNCHDNFYLDFNHFDTPSLFIKPIAHHCSSYVQMRYVVVQGFLYYFTDCIEKLGSRFCPNIILFICKVSPCFFFRLPSQAITMPQRRSGRIERRNRYWMIRTCTLLSYTDADEPPQ